MQRIATYMAVKPGMEARYRQEHANIWPEVKERFTRSASQPRLQFMRPSDHTYQEWQARLAQCIDQHASIALDVVFYVA